MEKYICMVTRNRLVENDYLICRMSSYLHSLCCNSEIHIVWTLDRLYDYFSIRVIWILNWLIRALFWDVFFKLIRIVAPHIVVLFLFEYFFSFFRHLLGLFSWNNTVLVLLIVFEILCVFFQNFNSFHNFFSMQFHCDLQFLLDIILF